MLSQVLRRECVWGSGCLYIYVFLTSTLVGGELLASRPSCFTPPPPGKEPTDSYCTGGWMDPRDGKDDMQKWTFWSYQDSNSNPLIFQPLASRYTDYAREHLKLYYNKGRVHCFGILKKKLNSMAESASELYRLSDRRLSAKFVPTFNGKIVPRGECDGSLRPYSRFLFWSSVSLKQSSPRITESLFLSFYQHFYLLANLTANENENTAVGICNILIHKSLALTSPRSGSLSVVD
jgi:hypothetical protein